MGARSRLVGAVMGGVKGHEPDLYVADPSVSSHDYSYVTESVEFHGTWLKGVSTSTLLNNSGE